MKNSKQNTQNLSFLKALYNASLQCRKILLRADYNYTNKSYNDIYNTEILARQPSHMLNGRLSFSTKDNRYGISIWGKNLLDQTYFENVWTFTNWTRVALNPPRTFGVEFRMNFY